MEQLLGPPTKNIIDQIKNIVFAFAIMLAWFYLITTFLDFLATPSAQFEQVPPKFAFFFSCIAAPAWEEMAFRWLPITIAKGFHKKFIFPIVILSSLIFGWGHGFGPVSLLIQGVMGFILSCLYLKNGNIWSSMALHSMWNMFCFFILA